MATPSPLAPSAWVPQSIADWAPLLVSAISILGLLLVLAVQLMAPASPMPERAAQAPVQPPAQALSTASARIAPGRVGTVRLVSTAVLPAQKQPLLDSPGCRRSPVANPSASAQSATSAGWHVSQDLYLNGYQVVLVDAGVEAAGQRCVPVGASLLVFNAQGLVAIAYDRNGKRLTRLATLIAIDDQTLGLHGAQGALAEVVLGKDEIRLNASR